MRRSSFVSAAILMLVGTLAQGCQTQPHGPPNTRANSQVSVSDEESFKAIWKYYRGTFPSITFEEGEFLHAEDGPLGRQRLHVAVPLGVDTQYQHRFSEAFLSSELHSRDGLTRCIAGDLLLMRHKRLFTYQSRHGYDGTIVDCTTYVVEENE